MYGTEWASGSISYSFPPDNLHWFTDTTTGYGPKSGLGEPWSKGFEPLNPHDMQAVRAALASWTAALASWTAALASWTNVAKLNFSKVADSATNVGDLRFAYSDKMEGQTATNLAWTMTPSAGVKGGDVWFNKLGSLYTSPWTPGSYEYKAVIHEIGHALGLKHPFEASPYNTQILSSDLDSISFTMMSGSAEPGYPNTYFSYNPTTPMILDIKAIQSLYGENTSYNSGNTQYVFSQFDRYHQTIWDAGGVDTIAYNSAIGGTIDLNAGIRRDLNGEVTGGSMMGSPVYVQDSFGSNQYSLPSIWIAYDVVIENATGGSGNDLIIGNHSNNVLKGRLGTDTVSYESASAGVTVNLGSSSAQNTGGAGRDTLSGFENLTGSRFNDTLMGNADNNVINGDVGNDKLYGGAGKDILAGGAGNDMLAGGTGADYFRFNTALNAATNKDIITDFNATDDLIQLENSIMTAIGSSTGKLASTEFFVGTAAHDANDSIIYNQSTGASTTTWTARGPKPLYRLQHSVLPRIHP